MTQAKDVRFSNSFRYPTPEEVERVVLEANRLRNEYIVNLIIRGWNSLRVRQRGQRTQRAMSDLDNRLLRDVGLVPEQRKRSLG